MFVCTCLLFIYILCPLVTQASYGTFETFIELQISVFFSHTPSPLPIINLNHVDAKTFDASPNSDLPKTLLKGKHKAFDIVVFKVNSTGPVKKVNVTNQKRKNESWSGRPIACFRNTRLQGFVG